MGRKSNRAGEILPSHPTSRPHRPAEPVDSWWQGMCLPAAPQPHPRHQDTRQTTPECGAQGDSGLSGGGRVDDMVRRDPGVKHPVSAYWTFVQHSAPGCSALDPAGIEAGAWTRQVAARMNEEQVKL